MNTRSEQILEAAIQSFIDTGEPVSSGHLYERYDFGIKPAMIRLELDALEEAGYLGQPHHSAGRVPTDAGYEFFARRILESEMEQSRSALQSEMANLFRNREWPDLLDELSSRLGILSVAADLARDMVWKTGLEELIASMDWQNREELRSVIRDFEQVDERLPQAAKKLNDEAPQVFIGRKSPVTKSENLSVVGEKYKVNGEEVFILAVGPKRMDYRKVIRMFKSL